MTNSLIMFPNLQFDQIPIPEFTIVEIYEDKVADGKGLGYFVIPTKGKNLAELQAEIKEKALEKKPAGKDEFIILERGYSRSIVQAVWYQGEKPELPEIPQVTNQIAAVAYDIFQNLEVRNEGAPNNCTITLTTLPFNGTLVFQVNDDSFEVTGSFGDNDKVVVSKEGVFINDKAYANFMMQAAPTLEHGDNTVRVKKQGIKNAQVSYRIKY